MSRRRELVVALEHKFVERGGIPYTQLAFPYEYWVRFLRDFDRVIILARLNRFAPTVEHAEAAVIGPGVEFVPMPYYVGLRGFFRNLHRSFRTAWKLSGKHERFLLRSGNVANVLWLCLALRGKPFLREFPGNVNEGILGFTASRSRTMRAVARMADIIARRQAVTAIACSYVSEAVRAAYPARTPADEYVFSSVQLVQSVPPRRDQKIIGCPKVVSVGRLEHEKGHHHLLRAVACARDDNGLTCQIHIIGDGTRRNSLERLADELQLDVNFHGAVVESEKLFALVRECNLFVLPSETEGMPRALIEAMSLKVPCIASGVGGVPEILSEQYLFPPGNVSALRDRLVEQCRSERLRDLNANTHFSAVITRFSKDNMDEVMSRFWNRLR